MTSETIFLATGPRRLSTFTAFALLVATLLSGGLVAQEEKKNDPARPAPGADHDHEKDHEHAEEPGRPAAASSAIEWHRSLADGVAAARKASRPLLVDFEAEWCGWCKKLDRETYGNDEVIRFVTNTFVAVKIDVDADPDTMKKFGISGLPTIVFLEVGDGKKRSDPVAADGTEGGAEDDTKDGAREAKDEASKTPDALPTFQELMRIEGYRPPDVFLAEARRAAAAGLSLAELRSAALADPTDADAQRAYARALLAGGKTAEAETVLREALARIPGSPVLVLEIAEIDRVAGRYEKAVEGYRGVLASPAADAEVRRAAAVPLARSLLSLERPEEAEKSLGELLDGIPKELLEPRDPAARREGDEGAPDEESGAARPKLDASVLEALFLRGYIRAVLERPAEALVDLRIARDADPEGAWGFRAAFIIARLRT